MNPESQKLHGFVGISFQAMLHEGTGYLQGATHATRNCLCRVIGNGTTSHPLTIQWCKDHSPEAEAIRTANEQAAQNDRASFAELEAMLDNALPGFKGCPAPDDWTKAALRELIAQRDDYKAAAEIANGERLAVDQGNDNDTAN